MKLYYLPGACSLADHIALCWSGLPFEVEAVPRDQLKGEFLKINPSGSVPALALDDGTVLTQNLAILNYIADLAATANLAGKTPRERAEALRWTAFVNADVHKFFSLIFGAGWGIGGLCPGPALADLAIAPVPAGVFVLAMLGGMLIHRFATQ